MTKIKNLKQKREEMRAVAKRKETLFPYSLKWFVFFKYASLVAAAIIVLSVILTLVDYIPFVRNGDYTEGLSEGFINTVTIYINAYVVFNIIEIIALIYRYEILSLLPAGGYLRFVVSLFVPFFISLVNTVAGEYIKAKASLEVDGIANVEYGFIIFSLAVPVVSFILNFIYFRKRKAIFNESAEYSGDEFKEKPATTRPGKWIERIKEKRAVAKRKEILCPRPLKWFKFFKYVSLVSFVLNLLVLFYSLVVFSNAFAKPEFVAFLTDNYIIYVIISIACTVLSIAVCLWRFIVMSLLPSNGYKRLIIILAASYVLSFISKVVEELTKVEQATAIYGQAYDWAALNIVSAAIGAVLAFVLNYVYFKKRKILFSDDILDADKMRGNIEPASECPDCKEPIPEGQMFCDKCGANVNYTIKI